MRIGVFLPNWIGDVVMATPALRSLRALAGDGGSLVGVMRPYVAETLAGLSLFDTQLTHDRKAAAGPASTRGVLAGLRDARLDAVVLLTNSLRTAWLAWRSGAPQRVGYSRDARGWLLTTRAYEPRKGRRRLVLPAIDAYLHLAYAAGGPWEPPTMSLATTPDDEARADHAWGVLGIQPAEPVAVFNTGGAFGSAKAWPLEHFALLATRVADQHGLRVVVNCGPAERDAARQVERLANHPRVQSLARVPDLPLGLSKSVVRRADLLVTTDSGPRYFGVAFGKPVVTLFGPTDPAATRTHYPLERVVSLGLPCAPCWARSCPLKHHRCLRDLTPDRVAAEVAALLARPLAAAA